jgi:uncharacterized protein YkwD
MPGESPRPDTADNGWLRPWSALIVLLLFVAFACSGGELTGVVGSRPTPQVKSRYVAARVIVPTPSPDSTPVPTPAPTAAPTPEPTVAPPPVPTSPPPPVYVPPPPPPTPVYVPPPPPPPPAAAYNQLSASLVSLINGRRSQGGLHALAPNAALMAAAQRYAELHFAAGPYQLSHTLDGTPSDRAARAGYSGSAGEVLVTGEPTAAFLMDVWMGSPPHASLIMGDGFADLGVGCAVAPYTGTDGVTWDTALCVGMMGMPY